MLIRYWYFARALENSHVRPVPETQIHKPCGLPGLVLLTASRFLSSRDRTRRASWAAKELYRPFGNALLFYVPVLAGLRFVDVFGLSNQR
jgi:hypothetical protein